MTSLWTLRFEGLTIFLTNIMKLFKCVAAAAALTVYVGGSAFGAGDEVQYREFTNSEGKSLKAVLIDKNETKAVFLLRNGKRATVDISSLEKDDQEFIRGWNKAKAFFLQQCKGLTVGELLTLRGYEAIPIKFDGNSMLINAKINGKPAKFIVDTGAGTSLFHTGAATRTGCKLGEFTEKVYGVSGEASAAWAEVAELSIGESVFKDRKILATDMTKDLHKGVKLRDDGLFGAEFLSDLDAVISYQERMLYLRPDNSDLEKDETAGDDQGFRIFKTKDKKVYRGNVEKKTATVVTIKQSNGKTVQLPLSRLIPTDANYVFQWSEEGATFLKHCQSLSVQELLELRHYQHFQYERKGNHIFVDGKLNDNAVTWLIDTGADNSLLHLQAAKDNKVEVGPMDQKVYGVGGSAPAAGCMVDSVEMGNALFRKRKLLATDLDRFEQGLDYVGLFGADFMRECNAVITYREQRIFLKQGKKSK